MVFGKNKGQFGRKSKNAKRMAGRKRKLEDRYQIKIQWFGLGKEHQREEKILNSSPLAKNLLMSTNELFLHFHYKNLLWLSAELLNSSLLVVHFEGLYMCLCFSRIS